MKQFLIGWIGLKKKGNDFPTALVGNKSDKENKEVTKEKGEQLEKQYKISFFETSNKTGENVEKKCLE